MIDWKIPKKTPEDHEKQPSYSEVILINPGEPNWEIIGRKLDTGHQLLRDDQFDTLAEFPIFTTAVGRKYYFTAPIFSGMNTFSIKMITPQEGGELNAERFEGETLDLGQYFNQVAVEFLRSNNLHVPHQIHVEQCGNACRFILQYPGEKVTHAIVLGFCVYIQG
jgi:hypothetical protein